MSYQRKTRDEFEVQGRYPTWGSNSWDVECSEYTRKEARERLKEYRENGIGEYRLIKKKVKL